MEREANYVAVGAFVLVVIALGAAFVYWYSESRDRRDYARYEIYFEGSVSGLQKGAPVRFLGVDVGRVVTTRLDRRSSGRVQIIADIDSEAPITERTAAELSLQGVTGLLYIDLLDNRGDKQVTDAVPSERYPVIPSVRSRFDAFLSGLPATLARVDDVLLRVTKIVSDDNLRALASTMSSVELATAGLPATMKEVDGLVSELRVVARDASGTLANVRSATDEAGPQVTRAVERMAVVADNLAKATARIDQAILENQGDVRGFARNTLPEIERALREAREAAQEVRDLSRSVRERPSQFIYRPNYEGVEIPR